MKMKKQITINSDLQKRAEAYAKSNYLSFSALCSQAIVEYIKKQEFEKERAALNELRRSAFYFGDRK